MGDLDGLVDALRWFDKNRGLLPMMSLAARRRAEECTWDRYRQAVTNATSAFEMCIRDRARDLFGMDNPSLSLLASGTTAIS